MNSKELRIKDLVDLNKKIVEDNTSIRRNLSLFKLVLFIFLIYSLYMSFTYYNFWFAISVFTLIAFIIVEIFYKKYNKIIIDTSFRLSILKQYSHRFDNKYRANADSGLDLKSDLYIESDLDIFGKASLFSFLSFAKTPIGRRNLANSLKGSLRDDNEILERQAAIHELSSNLDVTTRISSQSLKYQEKARLVKLGHVENGFNMVEKRISFNALKLIPSIILTLLLLASAILALTRAINPYIPLVFFMINFVATKVLFKEINEISQDVLGINDAFKGYDCLIEEVSKSSFSSKLLNEKKAKVDELNAKALGRFNLICGFIASRTNVIFQVIFNGLMLADGYFILMFSLWQKRNSNSFRKAINALGEIEELISLSTIEIVKENSSIPLIGESFEVENIIHPLIEESKAVGNSFSFKGINIVTGSNMSGKTTFMRSLGVNHLLFLAGASVTSSHFKAPICKIFTSMKVVDDVNNNISTFYGEILRIKSICEALNNEKIIVLVDEIFKGTNTKDRIEGSSIFIKRLLSSNCLGIISTHDRELCEISGVSNYYFKEHYIDSKIEFDYKINEGISNTSNAIYLLKMAGIIEEEKEC